MVKVDSTREDLSINASITNVGLIIDEATMVISFLGVRTDRHGSGILTWKMSAHKKFQLKTQN